MAQTNTPTWRVGVSERWDEEDYGATWTLRSSAIYDWDYKTKLAAHPTVAGELWVAYGYAGTPLHRSQDGGATWVEVAHIERCWSMAFGAPAPGNSNPTVFIHGRIDGVVGLFRSDDASALAGNASAATWTRIDNPSMPLFRVNNLTGDPDVYGRILVATSGRGAFVIDRDGSTRSITFTEPLGAEVALDDGDPFALPATFPGLDPDAAHGFTFGPIAPEAAQ